MAKRKPGKYEHVVQGLEDAPLKDGQSYQDRVNELARSLKTDLRTMALNYRIACRGEGPPFTENEVNEIIRRTGIDGLEAMQKIAQLAITAYEQLLTRSLDDHEPGWGAYGANDNAVRLESGESISVNVEPVGQVEDKDLFREWCIANGLGKALQLWPSTMNAMTKERILAGQAPPDGVKVYVLKKVKLK